MQNNTKLKLSDAIRLGAILHPAGKFNLFFDGRTCAVGSAMWAAGLLKETDSYEDAWAKLPAAYDYFPELQEQVELAELAKRFGLGTISLDAAIMWLNDQAEMTREQIADWVERVKVVSMEEPDVALARA